MTAERDATDVLRRLLPDQLVAEYGETPNDWTELRSITRIARNLAAALAAAGLLRARDDEEGGT